MGEKEKIEHLGHSKTTEKNKEVVFARGTVSLITLLVIGFFLEDCVADEDRPVMNISVWAIGC